MFIIHILWILHCYMSFDVCNYSWNLHHLYRGKNSKFQNSSFKFYIFWKLKQFLFLTSLFTSFSKICLAEACWINFLKSWDRKIGSISEISSQRRKKFRFKSYDVEIFLFQVILDTVLYEKTFLLKLEI